MNATQFKDGPAKRRAMIRDVKRIACTEGGYASFSELAAVTLASHFLDKGQSRKARRILEQYLSTHAATPRALNLWRLVQGVND